MQNNNVKFKTFYFLVVVFSFSFLVFSLASEASASASLYLAPSQGTFFVGSTFDVSVFVNTKGLKINAIELELKFPSDVLQITSPVAGESFISEWLTPPNYSNEGGTISFKGGIPEGIATSAGLISTVTFRAKSSGKAKVEFIHSSKVLLADGKGTQVLTANIGGTYEILIPPPEGPKITSITHSDPDIWYSDSAPVFSWEEERGITDFSYSFSQNPYENPDTLSEGLETFKSEEGVSDGIWYFHLRAKKDGVWGKTSHYSVKTDTTPPQRFEPTLELPAGFVYFEAKDIFSGIAHYEASITDFSQTPASSPFFIETVSPFKIPFLNPGKYRLIVRAFDRAGNERDSEITFQIISPAITYVAGKGFLIKGVTFTWPTIYFISFLFFGGLGYLIFEFLGKRGYGKGLKEIKEALAEIENVEKREMETRQLKEKFKEEKAKLEKKLK